MKPPPVYRVILAQLALTLLLTAIFLLFATLTTAYSILLGGLISALSNSYFVVQAFRFQGARNAKKVVNSFIKGELGKILISIVLFALSFTLITNLNELALILGFVATHFCGVVSSSRISYTPVVEKQQSSKAQW